MQNIEDKEVCTGRCNVKVIKKGISGSQANVNGKDTFELDDDEIIMDDSDS